MNNELLGGPTLRIDNFSSEILRLLSERAKGAKAGVKKRGSLSPYSSLEEVSVELSKELSQLQPEPIDREKVEAIKKAVAEGRYPLNPEAISEAILKELLGQ
jgi:negative regulator of flagellin synthesis FlgM